MMRTSLLVLEKMIYIAGAGDETSLNRCENR
jgi:hypothetical protein